MVILIVLFYALIYNLFCLSTINHLLKLENSVKTKYGKFIYLSFNSWEFLSYFIINPHL